MRAEVDIRSDNLTTEEPTGRASRVAAYVLTVVGSVPAVGAAG